MRSSEVYRVAREALAPWCKPQGFNRTTGGMLGWYKPVGDRYLVFWLQCSQGGWDPYAGSRFVVEFQLSPLPQIGACGKDDVRHRLPHFLTADDLDQVRVIQNAVIRSLPRPDPDYFILQHPSLVGRYLADFEEIEGAYQSNQDIWLRYFRESDVTRWAEFLLPRLPRIFQRLTGIPEASTDAPA